MQTLLYNRFLYPSVSKCRYKQPSGQALLKAVPALGNYRRTVCAVWILASARSAVLRSNSNQCDAKAGGGSDCFDLTYFGVRTRADGCGMEEVMLCYVML